MKTWVGFLVTLLIAVAATGCAPKTSVDGYVVMFEGPLSLSDQDVYFTGVKVGTIVSMETSASNVTRVVVSPDSDFKDQIGADIVLYAHAGRLEVSKLKNISEPLETGMPLCGFSSKSELSWFKFKTLLSDRVSAARKHALELQARFG